MTKHLTDEKLIDHQFKLDSGAKHQETATHLEACDECRQKLDLLKQKFSALDVLRDDVPVSERLVTNLMNRVQTALSPRVIRFRRRAFFTALAAAAAIVLLLAFPWLRQTPLPGTVQPEADLAALRAAQPFAPAGNIELNVLPTREKVQLTIYNSADLTLVRERRNLTMKRGWNWLQFMWANTLIDPTSLRLEPVANKDKIEVQALVFPPRIRELGRWLIFSELSGQAPVEITYFTSGLSWRAFYMGTLTPDEKTMRLQGYVRASNNSGEDYENAQTRLIVGKVHILDEIAELARRHYPYGSPIPVPPKPDDIKRLQRVRDFQKSWSGEEDRLKVHAGAPKEITKEGLSEYFLYTIEGTETIPNGWGKRLPSLDVADVPVINLYKYEKERYGKSVVRFLNFKNDKEHKLGDTPIPGGMLKVYRNVDDAKLLSYVGQSSFKYIPVDEDVELNLGAEGNVVVEPKVMDFETDHYLFDNRGNINGWDEIREVKVEVKNTRDLPVKVEIQRNFPTQHWDLEKKGKFGKYEKVDLDTVKFTLELDALSKREFTYVLTTHHGTRAE